MRENIAGENGNDGRSEEVVVMGEEKTAITSAWDNINFCSCVDRECPNNPVNCTLGCTPCVEECLRQNEIPACFFRKQRPDMDRKQDYPDFCTYTPELIL